MQCIYSLVNTAVQHRSVNVNINNYNNVLNVNVILELLYFKQNIGDLT